MYHRSKFELDPTSIKHFSRPRKVQAQYSAYIVKMSCDQQLASQRDQRSRGWVPLSYSFYAV